MMKLSVAVKILVPVCKDQNGNKLGSSNAFPGTLVDDHAVAVIIMIILIIAIIAIIAIILTMTVTIMNITVTMMMIMTMMMVTDMMVTQQPEQWHKTS